FDDLPIGMKSREAMTVRNRIVFIFSPPLPHARELKAVSFFFRSWFVSTNPETRLFSALATHLRMRNEIADLAGLLARRRCVQASFPHSRSKAHSVQWL